MSARGSSRRSRRPARTGDLSENAEYHAAKEAQSLNEGRILELEEHDLARRGHRRVEALRRPIKFGATVKLVDEDTEEEKTYQIVGDPEADVRSGRVSISSPIARALIGKTVGDTVEVTTPGGGNPTRSSAFVSADRYRQEGAAMRVRIMSSLSRRTFLAGFAGAVVLAPQPAPAQGSPIFLLFAVDVSVLKAKGLGPFADLVAAATLDELRRSFADRVDPRGPRLVVRVTAVNLTAFPDGGGERWWGGGAGGGGTDSVEGEALAVGRRGEILASFPQLAVLDVHSSILTPTNRACRDGLAALRPVASPPTHQLISTESSIGISGSSLIWSRVKAVGRCGRSAGRSRSETRPWKAAGSGRRISG